MVAVGLLVGWLTRNDTSGEVAVVGSPAPDFAVPLLAGGTFDLSDHLLDAEGPTVVNLWASWCLPCRAEIPEISAFASSNPEVTVIGIAVEDQLEAATAFADELRPSYPLAFHEGDFGTIYPYLGLPVTIVIDDAGILREIHNGIVDAELLGSLVSSG